MPLRQGIGDVQDTAPQSVDRPHHQDIEPPPYRVLEHHVECGALIPTFGSADSVILVGLDNRPATVLGYLLKDEPLILSGLVVAAHAKVDRSASAIGAHLLRLATSKKLCRNDTMDRDFVERCAWEWAPCGSRSERWPHRLSGL